MHPVGPLNSKVYWVRRVSIVVLAVAVLIGLVWFLASRTSRSSAGQDSAAVAVNTSAAPTLTGVLAASSGATRSTVPSASPMPDGQRRRRSVAGQPDRAGQRDGAAHPRPLIPRPRLPRPQPARRQQPPLPRQPQRPPRRPRILRRPPRRPRLQNRRPPRPAAAVLRRAGQADLPGQRHRRHGDHATPRPSPPAASRSSGW